ncbi:hypothetical protein MiYa_00127 [Microcystis aeruginosa NIES-2519]|uniref:Uncharacterized protein n=1 Tax=Microcystis aeruginosa NIES-2519 TaxID=2303981 RepID=A0A5A5R5V5_MICAE|nr:hypothetical protein MiYa_00127 [Microcystis aeruginosa NIES-2519]
MVIFNASFAPISYNRSYHKGGGSQGLFNHNFLLIFMFKIVLVYINIFDWLQGYSLECR